MRIEKQTYGQARITELILYRHKIKKDRRLKRYDGENRKQIHNIDRLE